MTTLVSAKKQIFSGNRKESTKVSRAVSQAKGSNLATPVKICYGMMVLQRLEKGSLLRLSL